MSGQFVIKIDDKKALDMFTGISQRASNPIEANKIIADMMRKDVLNHFDRMAGGEDEQWVDLKPKTWEWKRKHGYRNILINTGELRKRNVAEAGKDFALVYNDMVYAKPMNNGDTSKNIPARPFMWLSKFSLDRIVRVMANYIVRKGLLSA